MKSLEEYNDATPAHELYHFLSERIVSGELTSFTALLEYTRNLPRDRKTTAVYARLFRMVKKLYWGFFRDIDADTYPKIWSEIVIPFPNYPNCGTLKRNLTISDVYVGILDLHGYTRFCEKNKNNLSMLQMLDDMLQNDVVKIARQYDVVLQRRQGDEMILVGASAADMLATTLDIISYFSNKRTINFTSNTEHRSGEKIILENMHISAGIAGGRKFTPFIITRDGDLSGGVVNTAARLQARANELSGDRSRILITKTVHTSFASETKKVSRGYFSDHPLRFFDSGKINFKGLSVSLCEVIYNEDEHYRLRYEDEIGELFKVAEASAWKDGLFTSLVMLLRKVYAVMPEFRIAPDASLRNSPLTNTTMMGLAQKALDLFRSEQDYLSAIDTLEELICRSRAITNFDSLCLEYAERIHSQYAAIGREYAIRMKGKLKEKATSVLPNKYHAVYEDIEKANELRERLLDRVRETLTPLELSQLWSGVVDEKRDTLSATIHSGKH